MKKLLQAAAILLAAVFLAACSSGALAPSPSPSTNSVFADASAPTEAPSTGAELALVTTEDRLATNFGQAAWQAISRFAGENGLTAATYKAETGNADAALSAVELAVKGGAGLVVTMDSLVTEAVAKMQTAYSGIHFVFLDFAGDTLLSQNSAAIGFSAEQTGWLAGYLSTGHGFETLACLFFGGEGSRRFSLGFLLGAEAAASRLPLPDDGQPSVEVLLLGDEPGSTEDEDVDESAQSGQGGEEADPTPAMEQQMQHLKAEKPELIFAADTELLAMAEDIFSTVPPPYFITAPNAAPKSISNQLGAVTLDPRRLLQSLLEKWNKNSFPGGQQLAGGVGDGDILFTPNSTLSNADDLDAGAQAAVRAFENGELAKQLNLAMASGPEGGLPSHHDLVFTHITVRPPLNPDVVTENTASLPSLFPSLGGASQSASATSEPE